MKDFELEVKKSPGPVTLCVCGWVGGSVVADQRQDRIQKQGCSMQVSMQTWAISQALGTAEDVPKVDFIPIQPSNMAFIGALTAWMFEF